MAPDTKADTKFFLLVPLSSTFAAPLRSKVLGQSGTDCSGIHVSLQIFLNTHSNMGKYSTSNHSNTLDKNKYNFHLGSAWLAPEPAAGHALARGGGVGLVEGVLLPAASVPSLGQLQPAK